MAKPVSRFAAIDEQLAARRQGTTVCTLCRWVGKQPAEDQDYINALLARPTADVGHTYIAKVIAGDGPEFNDQVVANHRKKHLAK